ncbi:uncharacterized protein LOC122371055 [Amphibalanus amphitrite]|nr:uncharacterized protein LOC122371055 [Amphibalanus amphitrite]
MGLKLESNTRRLLVDDRKEVYYRAEVQNRCYRREVIQLEREVTALERELNTALGSPDSSRSSQSSLSGEYPARPPCPAAPEPADREDVLLLLQFLPPGPALLAPPASRSLCASLPSLHLPDGGPGLCRRLPPAGSSTELWRPSRTAGRRKDRLVVPTYRVSDLSVISPSASLPPPRPDSRERHCAVQEGVRTLESTLESLSDRFPVTYRIQIRPKPAATSAAANGRL